MSFNILIHFAKALPDLEGRPKEEEQLGADTCHHLKLEGFLHKICFYLGSTRMIDLSKHYIFIVALIFVDLFLHCAVSCASLTDLTVCRSSCIFGCKIYIKSR